jgi:hypothetical protein
MDDAFVSTNAKMIELIVDAGALAAVRGCKGNWATVKDHVIALASATTLGQELYSEPIAHIIAGNVGDRITSDVDELFGKVAVIDEEAMTNAIAKTIGAVEDIRGVGGLMPHRTISITCCLLVLQLRVGSVAEEVTARFWAAAKTVAFVKAQLTNFWAQDVFLSSTMVCPYKATLGTDAFADVEVARLCCKHALDDAHATSSDLCHQTVNNMRGDLLLTDPSFILELAMMDLASVDGINGCLHKATLAALPSKDHYIDCANAAQNITLLLDSKLYQYSDRSAQGKLREIQSVLFNILNDNEPPITPCMAQCPVLSASLAAISLLVQFTVPAADTTTSPTLVAGADALAAIVDKLEAQTENVEPKHVRPLELYSYFIPTSKRASAKELIKNAHARGLVLARKKASGPSSTSGGASSSSGPAKKGAAKKVSKDLAAEAAMSYFT